MDFGGGVFWTWLIDSRVKIARDCARVVFVEVPRLRTIQFWWCLSLEVTSRINHPSLWHWWKVSSSSPPVTKLQTQTNHNTFRTQEKHTTNRRQHHKFNNNDNCRFHKTRIAKDTSSKPWTFRFFENNSATTIAFYPWSGIRVSVPGGPRRLSNQELYPNDTTPIQEGNL